jgi:hypothetical protein
MRINRLSNTHMSANGGRPNSYVGYYGTRLGLTLVFMSNLHRFRIYARYKLNFSVDVTSVDFPVEVDLQ